MANSFNLGGNGLMTCQNSSIRQPIIPPEQHRKHGVGGMTASGFSTNPISYNQHSSFTSQQTKQQSNSYSTTSGSASKPQSAVQRPRIIMSGYQNDSTPSQTPSSRILGQQSNRNSQQQNFSYKQQQLNERYEDNKDDDWENNQKYSIFLQNGIKQKLKRLQALIKDLKSQQCMLKTTAKTIQEEFWKKIKIAVQQKWHKKVLDMREFAIMDAKLKIKQLERQLKVKKEFTYDLRTLYGLRNSGSSLEAENAKKNIHVVNPSGGKKFESN